MIGWMLLGSMLGVVVVAICSGGEIQEWLCGAVKGHDWDDPNDRAALCNKCGAMRDE